MARGVDPYREVWKGYEPKVRKAFRAMLKAIPDKSKLGTIQAFIQSGDINGLLNYVSALYIGMAPQAFAVLLATANAAADLAAADIRAAGIKLQAAQRAAAAVGQSGTGPAFGATARLDFGDLGNATAGDMGGIAFQGAEGFAYNPVNPRSLAATRTWQGNLIREMSERARQGIMDTVREGITRGENPRDIARRVRVNLPLTQSQQKIVGNFHRELQSIAEGGIRSAASWGIYTPKQIRALRDADPEMFRRLNFTASEMREGRRWGKISRAAGTLAPGKDGVKPSRPLGFTGPPETQGGPNAYRLNPDGTPMDGMARWRLRDKTFDPLLYDIVEAREASDKVREAAARAKFEEKIDAMAARYRERWVNHRAENIARTETLRALNLGSYESWRQSIEESDLFEPDQVKRVWKTAGDDRVRMMHRAANGQKVGMNEAFLVDGARHLIPPAGPNCLPGDSLVLPIGGVAAVFVREAHGEFIVVETEGGRRLTVTPNHPCLTAEGWIRPIDLEVGDELIAIKGCGLRENDAPTSETRIEHVADLARDLCPDFSADTLSADFHGDAIDGQVAEVLHDADLMAYLEASLGEGFAKFDLPPPHVVVAGALGRVSERPTSNALEAVTLPTTSRMGGGNLVRALVTSHAGPLDSFLFTSRSEGHSHASQGGSNRSSADSENLSERVDAFATLIELDKVVRISRLPASGHVYNLETSSSTYIAQGILVHNCRCTVKYSVDLKPIGLKS